jgi:hypothetical protein
MVSPMHENHQRQQYFFSPPTVQALADMVALKAHPCCLCAPSIAQALQARGRTVRLLEIDDRFAELPGFVRWDLYKPHPLSERFDLILCDPPFQKVRLSQLFEALRVLCQGHLDTPIALCHLASRAADIQGALGAFGLQPTSLEIGYVSVRPVPENRVILYTNAAQALGIPA